MRAAEKAAFAQSKPHPRAKQKCKNLYLDIKKGIVNRLQSFNHYIIQGFQMQDDKCITINTVTVN